MNPNTHKRFGAFSSSEDPNKLADTVKGLIMGFSVLIIALAHLVGINIGNEEITQFAVNAGTAVAGAWTTYGLVKKFFIWCHDTYRLWKASNLGTN